MDEDISQLCLNGGTCISPLAEPYQSPDFSTRLTVWGRLRLCRCITIDNKRLMLWLPGDLRQHLQWWKNPSNILKGIFWLLFNAPPHYLYLECCSSERPCGHPKKEVPRSMLWNSGCDQRHVMGVTLYHDHPHLKQQRRCST